MTNSTSPVGAGASALGRARAATLGRRTGKESVILITIDRCGGGRAVCGRSAQAKPVWSGGADVLQIKGSPQRTPRHRGHREYRGNSTSRVLCALCVSVFFVVPSFRTRHARRGGGAHASGI